MSADPSREGPVFSVIVPTHSRPRSLGSCLAALAAQDYPRERFEVIVVDDEGQPPAAAVVDRFRSELDVRLIVQTRGGPGQARNRGARRASGRLLAFTDDDCLPDPAWLSRLQAAVERRPDAMVGGRVINALAENRYSSASQLITDIVYAHYNAVPERARFCASNNLALPAAAFHEIGGFDPRFRVVACEDRDLCDRWTHAGRCLVYAPEVVVRHAHPMGLPEFMRQHFVYGRGAVHFHRLRAGRGSGRMRDEMAFHADLRNLLLRPFRHLRPREALTTAALMILWQTVNAAGFFYESFARTGYRA